MYYTELTSTLLHTMATEETAFSFSYLATFEVLTLIFAYFFSVGAVRKKAVAIETKHLQILSFATGKLILLLNYF